MWDLVAFLSLRMIEESMFFPPCVQNFLIILDFLPVLKVLQIRRRSWPAISGTLETCVWGRCCHPIWQESLWICRRHVIHKLKLLLHVAFVFWRVGITVQICSRPPPGILVFCSFLWIRNSGQSLFASMVLRDPIYSFNDITRDIIFLPYFFVCKYLF